MELWYLMRGVFRDVVGIGSREYEHEARDHLILFIILSSVFGDLRTFVYV